MAKYYKIFNRYDKAFVGPKGEPVIRWYTRQVGNFPSKYHSLEMCAAVIFNDCNLKFKTKYDLELQATLLAKFFETEFCGTVNGKIYIVEEYDTKGDENYEEFVYDMHSWPDGVLKESLRVMKQDPNNYDKRFITAIQRYLDAQTRHFHITEAKA